MDIAEAKQPPACLHVGARIGLGIAVMLAISVCVPALPWGLPRDGCGAGVFGAVLVVASDVILLRRSWYAKRQLGGRFALVCFTVASATCLLAIASHGQGPLAFEEVFGAPPPKGVMMLTGQRRYAGIFDQDDILLYFRVDEATLGAILKNRRFVRDDKSLEAYQQGNWTSFLEIALGQPQGKYGTWGPERPMGRPVVYRSEEDAGPSAYVLYDASTGDTYVHRQGG